MWMSARFDAVLMMALGLAIWAMDAKPKASWRAAALIGLAICLCKETGWVWIGLLALGLAFDKDRRGWRNGFALSFIVALTIRAMMLHGLQAPLPQGAHVDAWAMCSFAMESMGRNALALLMPFLESSPMRSAGWGGVGVKGVGFAFFLAGPALALLGMKSWRQGQWGGGRALAVGGLGCLGVSGDRCGHWPAARKGAFACAASIRGAKRLDLHVACCSRGNRWGIDQVAHGYALPCLDMAACGDVGAKRHASQNRLVGTRGVLESQRDA